MLRHQVVDAEEPVGEHEGFVSGRTLDGRLTDMSIDVRVHPEGRYVAYVPRCRCGWTGPTFSATPSGFAACEQLWRDKHVAPFHRAREPHYGRPSVGWTPRVIYGTCDVRSQRS